ncbi:MAG: AraC family transcriptional regulator [Comamonadaceae bacterium]|nr:MAG: AraC family transcriptional regulator [Comamonadaceae bacterium]
MINRLHLSAMTSAWVHALPGARAFSTPLLAGSLGGALQAAEEAIEATHDPLHTAMWAQAAGDVALLAGDAQEAHSAYGRSLQLTRGPFAVFLAGRSAARRALCGEDISPAAYRFWQTPFGPDDWSGTGEKLAGRALMFQCSAFTLPAQQEIDNMAAYGRVAGQEAWGDIAAAMSHEFRALDAIRGAAELVDHVYWHPGEAAEPHKAAALPANARTPDGASTAARILEERTRRVDTLLAEVMGKAPGHDAYASSGTPLRIAPALQHSERIERAMVAIARRDASRAGALLLPLERLQADPASIPPSVRCELAYCFYKLRLLEGRQREAAQLYSHYARLVFDLVHVQDAGIRRLIGDAGGQVQSYTDDVGVRLPPRYRRAYSWMQSNIGDQDLSIKDVAAVVGVTQRALQQTFKKSLGVSPTEVMRRLRMEHIHRALIQAKQGAEPIMDIAHRFGVGNRTTLATSYRKYYAQPPSKTFNLMAPSHETPGYGLADAPKIQ